MLALQFLPPHAKDLGGGFIVHRLLPAPARAAVGPFVFFDHFGPVEAAPGDDHDVRPHPHIGLATLTYLYEGAMLHRDSTGALQRIEPGAVNWMTSGRGVVHSERTPPDRLHQPRRSHGLQMWLALPESLEDSEPAFQHHPGDALPQVRLGDGPPEMQVIAGVRVGRAFGLESPVHTHSPTLFVDLQMPAGSVLDLLPLHTPQASERGLLVTEGQATLGDRVEGHAPSAAWPAGALAVLPDGQAVRVSAGEHGARVALIGGEPLGPRFLWWNFVSSRRERIVEAADDWAAGRFPVLSGEDDVIPLPERRPLR